MDSRPAEPIARDPDAGYSESVVDQLLFDHSRHFTEL